MRHSTFYKLLALGAIALSTIAFYAYKTSKAAQPVECEKQCCEKKEAPEPDMMFLESISSHLLSLK
jgi:hypothetical protein